MKTVLIVEDNARSMEMLIKIIKNLRADVEIRTASAQEEAAVLAMKYHIDLFMLDIILNSSNPGDVSGMRLAEQIRTFPKYKYTPVIFITALEDPELHAYSDLHCYYYVEKPYDVEKVSAVILEALEFPAVHNEPQNVFFRKDGILYKKEISEILYIENSRAGQTVCCTNGNLKLPYKPSRKILEELSSDRFIQCSRYHIVNRDYIDRIDTVNRYIRLKGVKTQIEIGNSYKKRFLRDVTDE
ncbi:MAG: LytTR family DNA-binding domain-containing protein [Roseburia sp.]|nr:LytTR family DNA-binding domain-containing protein [Roseburia sp.]MCM1243895.1 LytTR family DNA-binding domain-containing protein [Roseburia sp.]